jgi:hypothetical protein
MNDCNFIKAKSIIELNESIISNYADDFVELTDRILSAFRALRKQVVDEYYENSNERITSFIREKNEINFENKRNSFLFNSLRFFHINEPLHSLLIANLLDPNGEHGQGNLFLFAFLKQIKITTNENDKWFVTAEKGRVDILIKRKQPHSVIVIENKSNGAIDQNNQLYRYWLQEMYFPNESREYSYTLKQKEYYRLIYLSSDGARKPHDYALAKPDWDWLDDYSDLPNSLTLDDVDILLFQKDIVQWLGGCLEYLSKNYRLSEYVKQYIDLWKI